MRIFFIGEGRLGNQIFQYAALSSIAPGSAQVVAIGLEDIEELFELQGPRLTVLRGGIWFKRFAKRVLVPFVLRPLARHLRLISYACDPVRGDTHRGSAGELELRRGMFASLVFVDGGYYQSSEFWRDIFPPRPLELRQEWRVRAREVIARHAGRTPARPYFLHLRRGDYIGYTTYGVTDLLLPTEFFREAIEKFRSRGGFDLLVVVTDDATWARAEFADLADVVVISEDPARRFRGHGRMRRRHRLEQYVFAGRRALHARPGARDSARILVRLSGQTVAAGQNPIRSSVHRVSRGPVAGRRMIRATAISVVDQGLLSGVNFLLALLSDPVRDRRRNTAYIRSSSGCSRCSAFCMPACSYPRSCRCCRDSTELRAPNIAQAWRAPNLRSPLFPCSPVAACTWLVAAWLGHPITLLLSAASAIALLSLWWREFVRAGHFAALEPLRVLRVDAAFAALVLAGVAALVMLNGVTAANVLWCIGVAGVAVTVLPIYRKARESRIDVL